MFIDETDFEKSPYIFTKLFEDFSEKVSVDNELRVFKFLTKQIADQLEELEDGFEEITQFDVLESVIDDPSAKLVIEAQAIDIDILKKSQKFFNEQIKVLESQQPN